MKPLVLCILDGVGHRDEIKGNAYLQAKHPFFDRLYKQFPNSLLDASGEAVGLPKNTMGNSEVGHLNLGAGKIVYQPSEFINKEIDNGKFFKNTEILSLFDYVQSSNGALHLIGLVSNGCVHSSLDHLYAILKMAKTRKIKNVYIHAFTDGRDTNHHSGINYLRDLENYLKDLGLGKIVTVMGRFYGMDRDNRWDRVEKAYNAIIYRKGNITDNLEKSIQQSYDNNISDEFIKPIILDKNISINKNDAIFIFNYRPDRLREIGSALTNPNFSHFKVERLNVPLLTMMPVSDEVICKNAYTNQKVDMPLGVYLSNLNITQLRIAETEKYAHVTYFFDGGLERDLKGCTRILIPSPKVKVYDETPEMSAKEITDRLIEELDKDIFDVVILNYANGDMVGHTGNFDATIKSIEYLDKCLERLYNKVNEKEGLLIITADHGNCEFMIDENGDIVTSHTTNKVPLIICTNKNIKLSNGKLSDVAPTILNIMGLVKPKSMTGKSLIK